jgi:hypothetical protein
MFWAFFSGENEQQVYSQPPYMLISLAFLVRMALLPDIFSWTVTETWDAPDIRPAWNPAFLYLVSGRLPYFSAGYPVRSGTGYPANV